MTNSTFAQRLINARKIRCLSQRELSNKSDGKVSSTAIEKYEKAQMMPSSDVVITLANALGMNVDYFFRPFAVNIDSSKFEFRKKSSMTVKMVESIKHRVCFDIEKYLEIESILANEVKFQLDYSKYVVEDENMAMQMARRFRNDIQIGSDAIVSAVELLESFGIKIIEIEQDMKFDGTCIKAGTIPVIVVNNRLSAERKRMTIFHELGHLMLRFAEGVDVEKMCTVFANEVLIPSEKFISLMGTSRHDISLMELKAIQREYGVSVDALMAKAATLNVISLMRYQSYHKKKNAVPTFKNEVEQSIYPSEHTMRFERLVYKALSSELISFSKAASLLEKPIEGIRENLNLM